MTIKIAKAWKTVAAVLGTVATWGITASLDGEITQPELFGLLLVLATGKAVYEAKNKPS